MKLKALLKSNTSDNTDTDKILKEVSLDIPTMAADSDSGTHNTLSNFNVAAHTRVLDYLISVSIHVIIKQELLLVQLREIEIESDGKINIIALTKDALKLAMNWDHELEYNVTDDDHKNNYVSVETLMLASVWNPYH